MAFHRQKIMWGREKGLFMENQQSTYEGPLFHRLLHFDRIIKDKK